MSETIYIEPAHEHRPAFAAWGLAQSPPLQTASAQGWEVPLDLYASIPAELLDGAAVDGYPYGVPSPQPEAAVKDETPETDPAPAKPRRKRSSRRQPDRSAETVATVEETGRLSGIDGDAPGWGADA